MANLDPFDRMLNELPRIAEAVNAFSSEDVQKAAFAALVAALNLRIGSSGSATSSAPTENGTHGGDGTAGSEKADPDAGSGPGKPKRTRASRVRKSSGSVTAAKGLNFWPDGKTSLPDFVAEKLPNTNYERNLVAVYYLEQILEITDISAAQVLAVFKQCGWPEPGDPRNALQVTASTKQWIDTKVSSDVKTTPSGRNMVEHTMPTKTARKS